MRAAAPPSWPAAARAVFAHEWRQLANAPLTYIFAAGFCAALASGIFLVADFFATDEASLRLLNVFLPWVALVLVPALAMRAWSDDATDRGLELAFSLPVPVGALVAGRFAAGAAVLLAALAATAPFPATVLWLGDPDIGALLAGYAAAAAFLASCFALCLMAAALVRDPVSAFVLGLLLLLLLVLLGQDGLGRLVQPAAPELLRALVALSPKFWHDRVAGGQVELAALVYFVCATAAALLAASLAVGARRRPVARWRAAAWRAGAGLGLVAALVLAVAAAREVPSSLDLTEERRFTLGADMLEIALGLPEGTEVTLYWSESQPSVPQAITSHAARVRDQLRLLEARSDGLRVVTVDPVPDSEEELAALEAGIARVPMSSGESFFLGVTASQGGRTGRILYLDIERERLLHYDLAVLLDALSRERVPKLGVLSPHVAPTAAVQGRPGLGVIEELRRAYDVAVIPHFAETLPEGLDALLVIDPAVLRTRMLWQIDQFVMAGGGLVVLLDPYLRAERRAEGPAPVASEQIDDIADLLAAWSIRYDGASVVGDPELAVTVADAAERRMAYPFWLQIGAAGLSDRHPTTAALNQLLFAEAAALVPGPGALALVETTGAAGMLDRAAFADLKPAELAARFRPDETRRVIAAVSGGALASAFAAPPPGAAAEHHLQRVEDAVVFAVADADWIFDAFALQEVPSGGQMLLRPMNDNWAFLLNMLESASGSSALIAIRSKGRLHRPFSRIEALLRQDREEYRERETALARQIAAVEAELAQIPGAAGVADSGQLPQELQQRIAAIERDLLPLRRELRGIRLAMRERVERLAWRLTILNLGGGPLLVALFGGAVLLRRNRWRLR